MFILLKQKESASKTALNLVLWVLYASPFEFFGDLSFADLACKIVFLITITSAMSVLELAALSCKDPFRVFHQDVVVLRPKVSVAQVGIFLLQSGHSASILLFCSKTHSGGGAPLSGCNSSF